MDNKVKQTISIVAVIAILGVAYYGSYLPLRKSQKLITTMKGLQSISSIDELKQAFSEVLDAPSPVGQEELVRHFANLVPPIIESNGKTNPDVVKSLMDYLNSYYDPIISYGRGMSFGQNLYLLGAVNELAFIQTKQVVYLQGADFYFSKGHELSPKRPQFLYGLFDIYRMENDGIRVKDIADQILSQWPDDTKTRGAYEEYLKKAAALEKK